MNEELERLENELSLLDRERHELRLKIGKLADEINSKTLELFRVKFGVFVGCVVINSENEEFQVTKVSSFCGSPRIEGTPRKKDGTWSKRHQIIWREWKVKE